uniref:Uncharacterized protein n=1 Tax=Tanacetum cinerariifolium TaxID=118510 RepID=A0A6L2NE69_TANCI|nr:hypothetical protein [Tanacetum cinerariifolium]
MPLKPDLSYAGIDKFVFKPVDENVNDKSSEEKTKVVRKNVDAPIVKDWVSDDKEENVTQPKIVKKTVRPIIVKKELINPRQQEKTVRKTVKKVEHNRQNTHSPRGKKRKWNHLMSQKLEQHAHTFLDHESTYQSCESYVVAAATIGDSCKYTLVINKRKCLCSLLLNKVARTTVLRYSV